MWSSSVIFHDDSGENVISGASVETVSLRSAGWNGFRHCLCLRMCVCLSMSVWVSKGGAGEKDKNCSHLCACVLWEFRMHFVIQTVRGSTHWPEQLFLHQFMMQFLFKVMKYTWLLPPDRTEAKNTWGTARTPRTYVSVTFLNPPAMTDLTVLHLSYLVISFTKELQPLSSFVHEDTIQVTSLHRTDLNGLFSPSHYLIWADMSCKAK